MMFDPSVGRWLEEDPIEFEARDPNLYRPVGNNPTNATDPSGLDGIVGAYPSVYREAIAVRDAHLAMALRLLKKAQKEKPDLTDKEIELRMAVLRNVLRLRPKSVTYGPVGDRDNTYWVHHENKEWRLKPGVSPSTALTSLVEGPRKDGKGINYCGCTDYAKILILKAHFDVLSGARWWDVVSKDKLKSLTEAFADKRVPFGVVDDPTDGAPYWKGEHRKSDNGFSESDLLPGDQIYIHNGYWDKRYLKGISRWEGATGDFLEMKKAFLRSKDDDDDYRGEEGSNVFYLGGGKIIKMWDGKVFSLGAYRSKAMANWATVRKALEKHPGLPKPGSDMMPITDRYWPTPS